MNIKLGGAGELIAGLGSLIGMGATVTIGPGLAAVAILDIFFIGNNAWWANTLMLMPFLWMCYLISE